MGCPQSSWWPHADGVNSDGVSAGVGDEGAVPWTAIRPGARVLDAGELLTVRGRLRTGHHGTDTETGNMVSCLAVMVGRWDRREGEGIGSPRRTEQLVDLVVQTQRPCCMKLGITSFHA